MTFVRPVPFRLPRHAVVPDYGSGGLFGLVRSIGAFLDGGPWRLPQVEGAYDGNDQAPVVVFLLIDGLGDRFLRSFGCGSVLHAHRVRALTSVFPSTTASAVTTVLSGLAPAAHGLTGWFVRDRRFGGVIAPLPTRTRTGRALRGAALAERFFPYPSLFVRRERPSVFVNPRSLAHSTYSRRHGRGAETAPYRGLDGMLDAIADAVAKLRAAGGGYVHAYYPMFDALCHQHGCTSGAAIAEFGRIDDAFAKLLGRLAGSGTHVVASADHGFIDSPSPRLVRLDRDGAVRRMLAAPLFGERRASFCAVRPGAEREFEAFAADRLAGKGVVVRSAALATAGFFGPGPRHHRLAERIGTHALLMEPGWTVCDRVRGEHLHRMIGVHGGLSPDEMRVPLIYARA